MIDKHAQRLEMLIAEVGLPDITNQHGNYGGRVRLKLLDEYTLILTIHQLQTQEVLDCLKSKGIEAYPEEEPDSHFDKYGTLYIPTLHPETDIVTYQKVLDDAD